MLKVKRTVNLSPLIGGKCGFLGGTDVSIDDSVVSFSGLSFRFRDLTTLNSVSPVFSSILSTVCVAIFHVVA